MKKTRLLREFFQELLRVMGSIAPIDRIFTALVVIYFFFGVYGLFDLGTMWGFIFMPLGATVGIYMGVEYPYPPNFKIGYNTVVLLSAGAIAYGLWQRRYLHAQILAVLGAVLWTLAGMIGLGTGT